MSLSKRFASAVFQACFIIGMLALTQSVAFSQAHQFVHPGISWSTNDLDRMAALRTTSPWAEGWNQLVNSNEGSFSYQMQGPFELVSNRPDINMREHTADSEAALYHAIQWYATRNIGHGLLATQIVNSWATTHTTWDGTSIHLHAAYRGGMMVQAAEILRHTFPLWTAQNTINCETYFRNIIYPQFRIPDPVRAANQGANNIWGALQVAVFLSDDQMFQDCLDAYLESPCGGISNSLANGQCGDTGRDQGHAGAMIGNLGAVAAIFYVQGVDVYEVLDNRLLSMMEYWCQYNSGQEVDYLVHGTCYGYYTSIGPIGRDPVATFPISVMEGVRTAYVLRKGLQAPQTQAYLDGLNPTIMTFLWHRDASFTDTATLSREAFVPFTNHRDVTSLTSTEIGNPNQSGNSNLFNGLWALNGSGNGLNERTISYHYAYTELVGDGEMIARVQSIENTDPDADAAIVIRDSLTDAQGSMASISARPQQGTTFSARVFDAADGNGSQTFPLSNLPDGPVWLKIERRGTNIFGFVGPDGVTWTPMQHVVFDDWTGPLFIGLAATSHNNSDLATAVFSDVQIFDSAVDGPPELLMDFDDFTGTQNLSGGGGRSSSAFFPNEGGGAGYNVSRQTNNDVDEANGLISLNSSGNGGARTAIESVASLDTTLADITSTFTFSGIEFNNLVDPLNNTGPARTLVGVRAQEGSATSTPDLTSENIAELGEGIYFLFEDADVDAAFFGTPGFQGISTLFSVDSANVVTVLDSFSLDTLDFVQGANGINTTPVLNLEFELSSGGYTFTLTGDTAGGAPVTSSGIFAGLTNAAAYANNQSEGPDLALAIDSISIVQTLGSPAALLGDCNLDGTVNFSDIPSFIDILISGVYVEQADCNEDGEVDFSDITPFIGILIGR